MPGLKDALQNPLLKGCQALGLPVSSQQQSQLLEYVDLLHQWNKVFNLTAIRDPHTMLSHHILDSLAVLPYLEGDTVLDVGSGAGLPGIPLAVMAPDKRFVLLDSNGKKTRFIQQSLQKLDLAGRVEVIKMRIEQYRPALPFATVTSRAFSSLEAFVTLCRQACDQHTVLLAMKGRRPDDELSALGSEFRVKAVTALSVPGLEAERHLVSLQLNSK